MIWLAYGIPLIVGIYLFFKYKHKIVWWEYLIPFGAATVLIFIFKWAGIFSLQHDVEYWGNYATEVRYYEEWDEWIPKTCSRSVYSGTDANGNSQYTTVYYDCSYRKTHDAYYAVRDNAGVERIISYYEYQKRMNSYGNSTFFDLGRKYYKKDGDVYVSKNPGDYENFELIASKHTYQNKLQSAEGDYKFPKISEEEVKLYKLYDYPEIGNFFSLPAVLSHSYPIKQHEQKKFDYINGILGKKKEVRVWVLIFENTSIETAYKQEAYWKGGNKNEFVVCVGIDDVSKIQWAHVFSWTEQSHLKGETKMYLEEKTHLHLVPLSEYLYDLLDREFVRREFSKLSGVKVSVPWWAIITTWGLTLVATILISYWAIKNDYEQY